MLTRNFKRKEFECHCGCGADTVDYELAIVLQDLADHFRNAVIINSGIRCKLHNSEIGGAESSQHLLGKAADVYIKNTHADDVYDYLDKKYPYKYGIGRYNNRTHIDVRERRARWSML